jgi:calcineurin-like phosphoesterase family protein
MKGLFYLPVRVEAKNHEILFWGCLHYGHDPQWEVPIWKRRGFNSSEEHDEGIIRNWNSKATDKTVGFLLGDTMFGFGGEEKFKKLMSRLNFSRVFIMSGNHAAGWKQAFESLKDNTLYVDGKYNKEVIFVPNYLEAYVNGQPIVMSHYAIASWNGQGKGSWMLHSHSHGSLYGTDLGNILYKAKIMDVGVERHPFPATFGEIKSNFNNPVVSFDHHNSKTENPF